MIVVGVLATLPHPHFLPAIASFAFLWILWAITRGRGMGLGDVKLAFLMGLFLGYPGIVIAFYFAFLTGAALGVILIIQGKKGWKSTIAFGPFLLMGTVVASLWGQNILTVLHL
jgi:prepilin signal peptidase PulO-like enzyme (type II secretory pathway)